jgi:hypothetical protein
MPASTSTSTSTSSHSNALFQLHYRKHKYTPDTIHTALLFDIQNYTPIYSRFFDINDTNYNSIQLNQKYYLQNIVEHSTQFNEGTQTLNHLETVIGDDAGNTHNAPIFVKYSPLLDPIRYLSGKYNIQDSKTMSLPKYNSTLDTCHEKMLNVNNASYVDGFFSYLTSMTLHTHNIVHGLDYYGSYLCKQREFSTNVYDDIEYLVDCSFFNTYENDLFTIDYSQFGDDESELSDVNVSKLMKLRNKLKPVIGSLEDIDCPNIKGKLDIEDTVCYYTDDATVINVDGITDSGCVSVNTPEMVELTVDDLISPVEADHNHGGVNDADTGTGTGTGTISVENVFNCNGRTRDKDKDYSSDSDSSQSNSSYTTIDEDGSVDKGDVHAVEGDENDENDDDDDDDSDMSDNKDNDDVERIKVDDTTFDMDGNANQQDEEDSDDESYNSDDENITVKIKDFPVQAILLEKCVSTLDHIMMTDELTKEEWSSILFQVIMTLVIYQKMFEMTHNDLHTNNVMFVETTEEFIYYLYNNQYYKVPTYGRIFKIIDFGRAIYKFRGQLICSDSFHSKGDAATQYNFPPYYNPDKELVEPNYSFDLCRFACALFDYFIYDLRKVDKLCRSDPIIKLIVKWTTDDKGRNVLYKSSGQERYPDFKLYKMITRSVHGHIPSNEITNPLFDTYKITLKKYKKHAALSAKFLTNGRNTHIIMNVDALPSYSNVYSETSSGEQELRSSQ